MTPKNESAAQQFSHSIESGRDVLNGEVRLNTISGEARVQLPPFELPPKVTLSEYSLPTFDEPRPKPEVRNVTQDSFEVKSHSSSTAVIWKWRAEGKLLAPAAPDPGPAVKADPVTAAGNEKGPDAMAIVTIVATVVGAIAAVLALFLPEFRHFFHLP